ncbi:MAG: hypothetical protein IKO62_04790 [Bacteroidales bacterium]|nr:hypothetical protein [Paludibacteraceae bacterium]MBR4535957.1 hypothetical protein [Bacteroidales bacterium]
MKKGLRFIFGLLMALVVSCFVGAATAPAVGAATFVAANLVHIPEGSMGMAVTPEIWTDYIIGNLFKNNEFLLKSVDESQYVIGGTVVHIPQAGAPSKVKRNRTSLPATITRRKDVDITYALDEFTTDPRFIPYADTVELTYDKMESCMTEDMMYLHQLTAEAMLYNWRPTYFIKATGTKNVNNTIHGSNLRTGVTVEDFAKAKTIFNKWGIPKEDRQVILNTEMYEQLCSDIRSSQNENLSAIYDNVTGELRKLEGFTILQRATTLMASNSTLTAVTGTKYFKWTSTDLTYSVEDYEDIENGDKQAGTSDCCYGLFWHPTCVARAMGSTQMFANEGDPTYYGDIYSFLQRLGGRARRGDGKGVLGLIQEYHAS